ncbi:hypothetical protein BaRGS_00032561 [Batillaria attramentaria]|uniref:Uncharacterized protein n=1 Tax=Batillaria attramentaria TaxID=370345 RepID=A0ABD0JP18_9CAEN
MAAQETYTKLFARGAEKTSCFAEVIDRNTSVCLAARTVSNKIHVFRGNRRVAILVSLGCPTAIELQKTQAGWCVWVAVEEGSIFRKAVDLLHSTPRTTDKEEAGNHSIFDDLLKQQNQLPSSTADQPVQILPRDLVLSAGCEVKKILCLKDYVILLCFDGTGLLVRWYPAGQLNSSEVNSDGFLPILLPYKTGLSNQLQPRLTGIAVVTSVNSESMNEGDDISSSQLCLPLHLFSALFGFESSVRTLPVLVFGLKEGTVFYLPLDCNSSSSKMTLSLKLLCCLSSAVVDISSISASRTLSEREAVATELQRSLGLHMLAPSHATLDALIITGASGQCCLLTTVPDPCSTDGGLTKLVLTFTLTGAVVCCCSKDKSMFVCTGRGIERCSLTVCCDDERERDQFKVDVTCEELHVASVSKMWLSGQPNTLMCETFNGDIVELDATCASLSEDSGVHMQSSLKELLVSVDVNSHKMKQLKSSHQQLNTFIQQMNIASHLLHFHRPGKDAGQNPAPVICQTSLKSDVGYHTTQHSVEVRVTNQSPVSLTNDWSIVATLHKSGAYSGPDEEVFSVSSEASPSSHTMPLSHGLVSGGDVSFTIPVSYNPSSPGTDVAVCLVLQYPRWLRNETPAVETSSSCVFVPISFSTIDVLHFLQVRQPGSVALNVPMVSSHKLTVESMVAQLKQGGAEVVTAKSAGVQCNQTYTISEDVPDAYSCKVKPHPTPDGLLRCLLSNIQADAATLTQASCTLQDPCGTFLSLSVEKKSSERRPGVQQPRFEDGGLVVVLKSISVSLLARVRLAIVRRFQKILTVGDLQKVINATESWQQQLQAAQDTMRRGNSVSSTSDVLPVLCSLYESMRNSPL